MKQLLFIFLLVKHLQNLISYVIQVYIREESADLKMYEL